MQGIKHWYHTIQLHRRHRQEYSRNQTSYLIAKRVFKKYQYWTIRKHVIILNHQQPIIPQIAILHYYGYMEVDHVVHYSNHMLKN